DLSQDHATCRRHTRCPSGHRRHRRRFSARGVGRTDGHPNGCGHPGVSARSICALSGLALTQVLTSFAPASAIPVPTQASGVFVTHNPVGTPRHHMGLALRNHTHTTRARIVLDCPPHGDLSHVPAAIKGHLVGVVCIKCGGGQFAGRRYLSLSATFRVLTAAGSVFASHKSIVTYWQVRSREHQRPQHPLDYVPICDLSLPNVL